MIGERPMGEAPMADFLWPSLTGTACLRLEVATSLEIAASDPVGDMLARGVLVFVATLRPHYLSDRVPE